METNDETLCEQNHWATYKPMYFGVVGIVAVLLMVWMGLTFFLYPPGTPLDEAAAARGQFGDMFGLANALFSGMAFAALIFSLHMQRNELALQRAELALTRNEMALARGEATRQAEALGEQARTMAKQLGNELLAARINGTGILLQVRMNALEDSNITRWMTAQGQNPYDAVSRDLAELTQLLKVAADQQTSTDPGIHKTSTDKMP